VAFLQALCLLVEVDRAFVQLRLLAATLGLRRRLRLALLFASMRSPLAGVFGARLGGRRSVELPLPLLVRDHRTSIAYSGRRVGRLAAGGIGSFLYRPWGYEH